MKVNMPIEIGNIKQALGDEYVHGYNAGLEKAVEIAQSTYYESPDLKEDTDVVVTKIIAAIKKAMKC